MTKVQEMGLPLPLSLLLATMAFEEQTVNPVIFRVITRAQKEVLAAERGCKKVEEAISTLDDFLEKVEDTLANPGVPGQRAPFRSWRYKSDFKTWLAELQKEVDFVYRAEVEHTRIAELEGMEKPNKQRDRPDSVYRAYGCILELAKKHNRVLMPDEVAGEIFAQIGIEIKYSTYQTWKTPKRRKQK